MSIIEQLNFNIEHLFAPPYTESMRKGFVATLVLGLVVSIFILGATFYLKPNQKAPNNPSRFTNPKKVVETTNWKTYTNNFYHIKFDIPSQWISEESTAKDGRPSFKLSSPNKEIIIVAPATDEYIFEHGPKVPEVQLGKYKLYRNHHIASDGSSISRVSLYNIPRQWSLGIGFKTHGDFQSNNDILLEVLKTFSFTQQEPSIDELVTYTIPNGWKKEAPFALADSSKNIYLHSPDIEFDKSSGSMKKGARIIISRQFKNQNETLEEEITNPLIGVGKNKIVSFKISTLDGLNIFYCWEGCWDEYYVVKDGYRWRFTFQCLPNCLTKAQANVSQYSKDRDNFINSINFK